MWIRKSSTAGTIVNMEHVVSITLVYKGRLMNDTEIMFQTVDGSTFCMPGDKETLDTLWFLLGTRDLTILLPKTETDS